MNDDRLIELADSYVDAVLRSEYRADVQGGNIGKTAQPSQGSTQVELCLASLWAVTDTINRGHVSAADAARISAGTGALSA